MIRLGDRIRLSAAERQELSALVGFAFDPHTVEQHDAVLLRLKSDYEQVVAEIEPQVDAQGVDESGVAEARLMAAVLEGLLIEG